MLERWKISQDVAPRTVWRLQGPSLGFMWRLSSPEKGCDWGRPTVFLLFWLLISLNPIDTDPLCHPRVNKGHLGGVGMVLCQVRILWSETLVSDQRLRQGCSCSKLGVKPDMGVGATSVKSSPCWDFLNVSSSLWGCPSTILWWWEMLSPLYPYAMTVISRGKQCGPCGHGAWLQTGRTHCISIRSCFSWLNGRMSRTVFSGSLMS